MKNFFRWDALNCTFSSSSLAATSSMVYSLLILLGRAGYCSAALTDVRLGSNYNPSNFKFNGFLLTPKYLKTLCSESMNSLSLLFLFSSTVNFLPGPATL